MQSDTMTEVKLETHKIEELFAKGTVTIDEITITIPHHPGKGRCILCGDKHPNKLLDRHHILPQSLNPVVNFTIPVCKNECHHFIHGIIPNHINLKKDSVLKKLKNHMTLEGRRLEIVSQEVKSLDSIKKSNKKLVSQLNEIRYQRDKLIDKNKRLQLQLNVTMPRMPRRRGIMNGHRR